MKPTKEHKKWITQGILDLMNERRTSKGGNDQYKELNKVIRNKCNEAKEIWLNNKCAQIEANSRFCTKDMHDEIRELTGKRKSCLKSGCIRAKDGSMLTDRNEILDRWAEYIEDLFEDNREDKPEINKPIEGPKILHDEVRAAMKKMKYGKAAGPDNITIEAFSALDDCGIVIITNLLNDIYHNVEIPKEMCKFSFIMLPKKVGTTECDMY